MKWARRTRDIVWLLTALLLVIAALPQPRWITSDAGTLAILLDVSSSVPQPSREDIAEKLGKALDALPRGTAAGVIAFHDGPRILGVGPADRASRWVDAAADLSVDDTGTDLGTGIRAATALVKAAGGGSILLATDGHDPVGDGGDAALAAARAGVDLHVVPLVRDPQGEVSLEALHVPPRVRAGGLFEAVVMLRSNVKQAARISFELDGREVAMAHTTVEAGATHVVRRFLEAGPRSGRLTAHVNAEIDADVTNNLASADVTASGAPRFAVLGDVPPGLVQAERWEKLPPDHVLGRFDAVFAQVGPSFLPTQDEQERLARFVRKGHGLVVSCSDVDSAAALRGGPLEEVLPVRLQPPDREGEEAAVVLLLDRSGSMAPSGGSASSVSLAAEAGRAVLAALERRDRYGVIAFDVAPHVLRRLGRLDQEGGKLDAIPDLAARGGTDWGPALDLALQWLSGSDAARRHVILVSDGRLHPEASGEPSLLWPDGITLSTVSVGDGAQAHRLERLSSRHGGRHEHVARVEDLPPALRREGARLRPADVRQGPMRGRPEPEFADSLRDVLVPAGASFVVTTEKPGTQVAVRSDHREPLLVFGRSGWGMTAFLALDPPSGAAGGLLPTSLHLVAGTEDPGAPVPMVWLREGRGVVEMVVPGPGAALPDASVRLPSGREEILPMEWRAPERASGSFIATERGEYLVDVGGHRARLRVDAPPERRLPIHDPGWARRLADAGGGQVLPMDQDAISSVSLPRRMRRHDWSPALLGLAALVVFGDAAFRYRRVHRAGPIKRKS